MNAIRQKPEERELYMVLKLSDTVQIKGEIEGAQTEKLKLDEGQYFIPVYSTIEEAEKASEFGKYQIRKALIVSGNM